MRVTQCGAIFLALGLFTCGFALGRITTGPDQYAYLFLGLVLLFLGSMIEAAAERGRKSFEAQMRKHGLMKEK